MNTQHLVLILLKYLCLNESVIRLTAIYPAKFNSRPLNRNRAHTHRFLSNEQRYLYLNYKEAYGLRFNPKKIYKRQHISNNSVIGVEVVDVTTIGYDAVDIPMVSIPSTVSPSEITTIATQQTNDVSIATPIIAIDNKVSSTESPQPIENQEISFSVLRKRDNISYPTNTTAQATQRASILRDTLNLIRKQLKLWLAFGSDRKTSLINGQRFLSVFNVIKFDNSPCTSTQEGLTEMSGTCYHDYQSAEMGGTSIDECADGLGVCCVFKTICGQTTNQMDSYFQNPGWPDASQYRLICTLTVELQDDVAQVRLDFVTFELKPPTDGNCIDDQFYVAGQNSNNQIPTLCGVNNGQHMYVEVENSMDRKIFLTVLTSSVAARAFNIRVIQNNLNYVICIRRQWNYCSTTYSNEADDVEYEFQLLNIDSEGTSVVPEKQAGIEIFSCNDDYISVNSIRLCGEKLKDASRIDDLTMNALITDTSNGLNFIPVRTNGASVGRGFRINYVQVPCEDQPVTMEPVTETTEEATLDENSPISKYRRN